MRAPLAALFVALLAASTLSGGAAAAAPCAAGTGSANCTLCAKSYYSAGGNLTVPNPPCVKCPGNTTTAIAGSKSAADCALPVNIRGCRRACARGALPGPSSSLALFCRRRTGLHMPELRGAAWHAHKVARMRTHTRTCAPTKRCRAGPPIAGCPIGYAGSGGSCSLCAAASRAYADVTGLAACKACPASSTVQAAGTAGVNCVAGGRSCKLRQRDSWLSRLLAHALLPFQASADMHHMRKARGRRCARHTMQTACNS